MPQHPGGPDYLIKNLGKNIDEDFEEAEHTKSAKRLFKDLPLVGKMVKE
jgi:cytochrome b involved in lipid metabolism